MPDLKIENKPRHQVRVLRPPSPSYGSQIVLCLVDTYVVDCRGHRVRCYHAASGYPSWVPSPLPLIYPPCMPQLLSSFPQPRLLIRPSCLPPRSSFSSRYCRSVLCFQRQVDCRVVALLVYWMASPQLVIICFEQSLASKI